MRIVALFQNSSSRTAMRLACKNLVLCGRTENLILFVKPFGNEIGVEVYDSVLDMLSLSVVAEHVAVKINTLAGRGLLKMASEGSKQNRRWLPNVRIPLR
jgi:hypothetical protein